MSEHHNEVALSFLKESGTNFPSRPKLVEDILVFQMPDGLGMQFRGLPNPLVLRGALAERILPKLLPLLDGQHDVSQLIELFAKDATASDIADLLKNLFTRGAIAGVDDFRHTPKNVVDTKHQLFFGRRLGLTRNNNCSSEVIDKLKTARIVVIAEGLLGATVIDLLHRSGFDNLIVAALKNEKASEELFAHFSNPVQVTFTEGNESAVRNYLQSRLKTADLVVAALRNLPQSVFMAINELCVQAGIQWLRACDNGSNIEVGPYVNPYDSACFECLLVRQVSVSDYAVEEELYQKHLEEGSALTGLLGESIGLATQSAAYIAQESVRILSAIEKPQLDGSVISFHSSGNIEQNWFTRVPRCEVCARGGAISIPESPHASHVS
jgi:bacteriocin biosynthesis cyclodehydratase domain-containing protein